MQKQTLRNDENGKNVCLDISAKDSVLGVANNIELVNITTKRKIGSYVNLIESFNVAAERKWRFKTDVTGITLRLHRRRRRLKGGPTSSWLGCKIGRASCRERV